MRAAASTNAKASKNSVQSLAKGFRVLEAFSGDADEMTLSEIADAAELDAGTTFRMLNTLVNLGYVARVGESRRFRLTLKVLDLGFNAIAHKDMRSLVRPLLQSLVDEVSEAASFGVLEGADILYIERVRAGFTRLGVDIRVGTTVPATISTIGYAVLAFLPAAQLDRVLSSVPRHSNLTVLPPSRAKLLPILDRIRERGYGIEDSLISADLRILAVPVLGPDGYAIGAISIAAPRIRVSENELKNRALATLQAAARDVARALEASGARASSPEIPSILKPRRTP
jgi:IclR family transcriptional regulator, pca regulon regulatory protein